MPSQKSLSPVTLIQRLKKLGSKQKAQFAMRFFKTGPGQYGEGDHFIGVTVPEVRKTAKDFVHLTLSEIRPLLTSKIHEVRLAALVILSSQFKKANDSQKKKIFDYYLKYKKYINNWDLIDLSASLIIGAFLLKNPKHLTILTILMRSKNLWDRRIAIVSTHAFIKSHLFEHTLSISKHLLNDKEDLIHKASGWMLREMGKKNFEVLKEFVETYAHQMPRTMLRYSIERFPEKLRKEMLARKKTSE